MTPMPGAKRLMTEDAELRRRITDRFGAEAYADGTLNRHLPCRAGLLRGAGPRRPERHRPPGRPGRFRGVAEQQEGDYVILESALLFDAGFDACVDRTVAVLAPEALRIDAPAAATAHTRGGPPPASPPRRTTIR